MHKYKCSRASHSSRLRETQLFISQSSRYFSTEGDGTNDTNLHGRKNFSSNWKEGSNVVCPKCRKPVMPSSLARFPNFDLFCNCTGMKSSLRKRESGFPMGNNDYKDPTYSDEFFYPFNEASMRQLNSGRGLPLQQTPYEPASTQNVANFRPPPATKLTPKQIFNGLQKHVIGQTHVKKVLSVSLSNHLHVAELEQQPSSQEALYFSEGIDESKVKIDKSNVLLAGSTGSGKTLLAKTLADLAEVPFVIFDATSLTQAGYIGDDVESIIKRLYVASGEDKAKTERGIVYLDEVDKLARRGSGGSLNGRDVSGEGVQQALLKLLEGSKVNLQTKQGNKGSGGVEIDTTNILFICGGAFAEIDRIVKDRLEPKAAIGFSGDDAEIIEPGKEKEAEEIKLNKYMKQIASEDLVEYGLIPEFIGRFSHVVSTKELTVDQLAQALVEPQNSIVKQYELLFSQYGVQLVFEESAIREIAVKAKEKGTGARGLKNVVESILLDTNFNLPELKEDGVEKIVLNKDVIAGNTDPLCINSENTEMKLQAYV
eukprot:augustus_masked-scaffold_13-processed-gene-3.11-mRNA-1 protein AED:0.39 eAED:0.39 QI:0/-1/0/1/-1/1/1/0/540